LFVSQGKINTRVGEIAKKCHTFVKADDFVESSFRKYLAPEQLSPDETATLIANVIKKMPEGGLS
jgi:hypothetical protein